MPSPEVQIALANLEALAGERVLLIGFEGPDLPEALIEKGTAVTSFQQNLRLQRSWPSSVFGDWLETPERFDRIAVAMPKEKARLSMQLAMVAPLLRDDGAVILAGHNDAGIKSAGRQLRDVFSGAEVLDYRYHCRILRAERGPTPLEASSPERWQVESHAMVDGERLTFFTYPGVFSHRALDDGTRMLLEAIEVPNGARALDVGCGSGVISAWLAKKGALLDAVDVDALALRATGETLSANGATGSVRPSDVFSDITERYRLIACNPPFHAGVRTSTDVAARLIQGARGHLERHGELWIVANRFLDYLEPLRVTFSQVEIVREDKRFRVYRAH